MDFPMFFHPPHGVQACRRGFSPGTVSLSRLPCGSIGFEHMESEMRFRFISTSITVASIL
ncbi:MAG: hypothetical protein JRC53_01340 [Deltaproteobacteria bacterium]|nr:hypothetical protein [Deltaproteobacteria bacterium]